MRSPGRPRKCVDKLLVVRLTLRLWAGEDDDLIAFFGQAPPGKKAALVRSALRNGSLIEVAADTSSDDEDALHDMAEAFLL